MKTNLAQNSFGALVLPDDHKKILESQVDQHFRQRKDGRNIPDEQLDCVRGKGTGLIILLHGMSTSLQGQTQC